MTYISHEKLIECRKILIDLMKRENLVGCSIDYIKNATKYAYFTLKSNPNAPTEHWEKLYQFLNEGIKIALDSQESITGRSLQGITSHMHSYGGDVASVLFRKTKDIEWAKKGYSNYIEAIRTDREKDLSEHVTYVADNAKNLAKKALEQTDNLDYWGVKIFMISDEFKARLESEDLISKIREIDLETISAIFKACRNKEYGKYLDYLKSKQV